MTLCIFLPTGRTFTFKGVRIIHDNETALVFDYQAMSDGLRKTGTFLKANLAGWSTFTLGEGKREISKSVSDPIVPSFPSGSLAR